MKINQLSTAAILLILLIITSCNPDVEKTDNTPAQRTAQLTNMYSNGIQPLHQDFETACIDFSTEVNAFSQDLTTEKLAILQQKWKTATELYKRCELYNIGEVNRTFVRFRIHRWETNATALEDTLLTNTQVTSEYMERLGSAIVGLAAIEYLLFETDANTTLAALQTNSKRLNYLVELSNFLEKQAKILNTTWTDFGAEFKTALESKITGGQNLMLNSMINYLAETIKLRLGKPLGETNGGTLTLEDLEAFRSNHSLELIKNGFEEFKLCYRGNYPNGNNFGFDNYIIDLENQPLSDRIETAIIDCDSKINALSDLNNDLVDNTQKVNDLKDSFSSLMILIKADLASFIGATVTINDTDGD